MNLFFGTQRVNVDISRNFFIFQNFNFWVFRGVKGQKMTQNYQFQTVTLCISGTVDHIKIFATIIKCKRCKLMISPKAFLSIFFKKMQHCFLNKYLFFKFISKYQKDILRCAPLSSHVCDFSVSTFYLYLIWVKVLFESRCVPALRNYCCFRPVGYEYVWV